MSDRLTIAVPRGALFDGTLDLLDALGVDTAEVRSNDRKLLFADAGIVTMRPSDVPTYVEHGSADIGITGKDVLLEQARAQGLRAARPGLRPLPHGRGGARRRRPDRRRAAPARPGAHRHQVPAHGRASTSPTTGRQAEIVEVKGSVELAPLTGLVDGIVDLTATGQTLEENHLRVVEEIGVCTARLIANPVAHKLKAAADRRARGADLRRMRIERIEDALVAPAPSPPAWSEPCAAILDEVRAGGDAAVLELHRALRPRRAGPGAAAGGRPRARGVGRRARAGRARRAANRDRQRARRGARRSCASRPRSSCREGQRVEIARGARAPRRRLRARRPGALSLDRRDGRGDRAGGGRRARSRSAPRRARRDGRTP